MDNSSGRLGEDYACKLLEQKGGVILCRNYTSRWGEIDVIARLGRYLVFAEVKTRASDALAPPQMAVTPAKQRRIIRTAIQFMTRRPLQLQPRFDVIALTTDRYTGEVIQCNHIENAFGVEGGGYAPF